jgi:hypothetical protein
MALPLPVVVADVGPGGGIVTARRGINALRKSEYENDIARAEAQFAPTKIQAEAASKLAYANLMGPQFLAKLMANDAFVANLGDDKAKAAVPALYQAGMGQGTGGNYLSRQQMPQPPQQEEKGNNSFLNMIQNGIGRILFGPNQRNPLAQQPQQNYQSQPPQNPMVNMPGAGGDIQMTPQQAQAVNGMRPGDAITIGQNGQPSQPVSIPDNQAQPTYAENSGKYKGVIKEGEEAGSIRAKNIDDLNTTVFTAENNQTTLDDMASILKSPEIEQIKQMPLAGHLELAYYAKEGTPQQKRLVGRLYTLMGNFVKDSARDFSGAFRTGEQKLLQSMKPDPSDTVDVMRGKAETLSYINQMLRQRSKITSQIMEQTHVSKGAALDQADKQINGDLIRQKIKDKLYPKPTDDDIQFMANKYKVSVDEINKRLRAKGII